MGRAIAEDPWMENSNRLIKIEGEQKENSFPQVMAEFFLKFYRNYLSTVDSDRCPSYPSCSFYAWQAIRQHGTWKGLIMTFDRLIHEADEVQRAPLIEINGHYRYYDPVENNNFWWYKK